jgi:phosphoglucosamine mutase
MLLCAAVRGRTLSEAAAVLPRFAQVKANVRVGTRELTQAIRDEVERVNSQLGDAGRVLVRPSGTEPLVRVLVEAEDAKAAERACGSIAELVQRELG